MTPDPALAERMNFWFLEEYVVYVTDKVSLSMLDSIYNSNLLK